MDLVPRYHRYQDGCCSASRMATVHAGFAPGRRRPPMARPWTAAPRSRRRELAEVAIFLILLALIILGASLYDVGPGLAAAG